MSWEEDLEFVVSRTNHEAYRAACADGHPDRETWRARMVQKAAAFRDRPAPEYPPLMVQAGNFGRAMKRWVRSGLRLSDRDEYRRRRAICETPCELYDAAQKRCKQCGCAAALKPWLQSETCPLGKW